MSECEKRLTSLELRSQILNDPIPSQIYLEKDPLQIVVNKRTDIPFLALGEYPLKLVR